MKNLTDFVVEEGCTITFKLKKDEGVQVSLGDPAKKVAITELIPLNLLKTEQEDILQSKLDLLKTKFLMRKYPERYVKFEIIKEKE